TVGPLGELSNFANNLTNKFQLENQKFPRWDSVKVKCTETNTISNHTSEYSRVVPLIQHYRREGQAKSIKWNVILLGIDSVSRLNFLRHMIKTKQFLEKHAFIPMYGYHKVGENSFPNILPMFTGRLASHYYN